MTIKTPSNLELLLHCHYSPIPHPRYNAPAIQEGIAYLEHNGMIVCVGTPMYRPTEKGKAFIQYLLDVPFPKAVWVIPDREA